MNRDTINTDINKLLEFKKRPNKNRTNDKKKCDDFFLDKKCDEIIVRYKTFWHECGRKSFQVLC